MASKAAVEENGERSFAMRTVQGLLRRTGVAAGGVGASASQSESGGRNQSSRQFCCAGLR